MGSPPQNVVAPGTSGLAIASCVAAGITLLMVLVQTIVMLLTKADQSGGQPTTGDWMLGFAMLGSLCGGGFVGVTGIVLGVIALVQPNRPRRFALIGLTGSAVLLVMLWVVMATLG